MRNVRVKKKGARTKGRVTEVAFARKVLFVVVLLSLALITVIPIGEQIGVEIFRTGAFVLETNNGLSSLLTGAAVGVGREVTSDTLNVDSVTENSENTNRNSNLFIQSELSPQISFISPTPENGTNVTTSSVQINTSIIKNGLSYVIYNWNGTNFTVYNNSLILMMNFENRSSLGENATFAVDLSQYGNNGTVTEAIMNFTSGKYGRGAFFDGTNDQIIMSTLNSPQQKTIALWVNANSYAGGYNTLFECGNDNPWYGIRSSGQIEMYGSVTSDFVLTTGVWYYVVLTSDASQSAIYINGVLNKTGSANTQTGSSCGLGHQSGDSFFNGFLDEARVWNRALSAQEVYEQYMTNLDKFNSTQWYLYVNQSKNATSGLDAATYTYQTFVMDTANERNETELRTVTVTTLNTAPIVTTPVILPSPAYSYSTLTTNTTYTDAEGTNGTIYFQWYVNQSTIFNFTNSSVVSGAVVFSTLLPGNFTNGSRVRVDVYANDGRNNSATMTSNTITINPEPPRITSVILNSTNVATNDTNQNLTVYAFTTDQENDTVRVVYTWFKNNNSIQLITMPFIPDGNQNATDYSGFNNNGTINGGAFYNSSALFGTSGSYQFDGSNDYVSITDTYDPENYTIAVWIKPVDVTSTSIFVRTDSTGPTNEWSHQLRITAESKAEHYTWDGAAKIVTGGTTLSANTWYHIVAVAENNGRERLYVNGVEEGTSLAIGALWTLGDRYYIGSNSGNSMGYYSGNIKEVTVYNYSLSAAQIRALYYNETDLITNLTAGDGWSVCATPNDNTTNGAEVCSNTLTVNSVAVPDTTLPRFEPHPTNQTFEYGTGFSYDINATDNVAIQNYSINYTTLFRINNSGGITNISAILSLGTYHFNLSINDTSNNVNWTFFSITVIDTTIPRFDPQPVNQTIDANTTFLYDINATDALFANYSINYTSQFRINSTGAIVNSSGILALGVYHFNISINDTSNNRNGTFFRLTVQDNVLPRFDPHPTNQTIEYGAQLEYDINATDNIGIHNFSINYSSLFIINGTGGLRNTSAITLGTYSFNISINDTSNNVNWTFFSITVVDTTIPRFDPHPVNQTIEANTTFLYDINATDVLFANYSINYTSLFVINGSGAITNSSPILAIGVYHFNISINDTSKNTNWTFFQLIVQDTIPPRFDPFPINQTIDANTSFSYDFNGTDLVSLVTFGVNDSAFNINSTGGLVNSSPLQFRTYYLNITINDTSNNKNSTFFQLSIQDTTQPRFDPLPTNQTLEYGTAFSYDINGTDLVSIVTFGINSSAYYINSTGGITNISPIAALGTYYFNLTVNDTSNNKNSTFFQIVVQDTTIPRFEPHPVNQTIEANTTFLYDVNGTDLLLANYSINYTSLFTINGSGAITNSSVILALGVYHFNISLNDTSNNRNGTFFRLTVQDTLPPRFEVFPINQTIEANTSFSYDFEGIDLVSLVTYGVNDSAFNINSTGGLVNSTAILALGTYRFNITINDTSNNKNSTFFQIVVQDTTVPRFDPLPTNQTIAYGESFVYDLNATDNIALFNFSINYTTLFAINDSGGLRNISVLEVGVYVFNISINDTFNNRNSTFFSVTMGAAPVPPSSSSSSSGGGGGGGGSSKSKVVEEIITPECVDDSGCAPKGFCKEQKCIQYECVENSDCPTEKYCVKNKCYKIFDIKLLQADSPLTKGEEFDFTYFLKGMADISGDVSIRFWLEKYGKKVAQGEDTIYVGTYEEKTEQANLFLPSSVSEGTYTFYIELEYDGYVVQSHRTVEIQTQAPVLGSVAFVNLPAMISVEGVEYKVSLATNKDVSIPAVVVHHILKNGVVVWSKKEDVLITKTYIGQNWIPPLEEGVYQFSTEALIDGKKYSAMQDVVVQKGIVASTGQNVGDTKAFAGQAIRDTVAGVVGDYSMVWLIVVMTALLLFFGYRRREKSSVRGTVSQKVVIARPLGELERWIQTMLVQGAKAEMIVTVAQKQGQWSAQECAVALQRANAGHNLKMAYGAFVTEEKLNQLKTFILDARQRQMSEEMIIAHLVDAEWNTMLIREFVQAYVAQP